MTLEDYEANGGWGSSEDGTLCAASFSGQPSLNPGSAESRFSLAPGTCVTVEIGDLFDETGASWSCDEELLCGTTYVFRAFSHASNRPAPGGKRSAFSDNLICSTLECGPQGCVFTQGYWKTHGLDLCQAGQNGNEWPASATPMLLGGVSYTADQLCAILKTPAKGNGLIFLAHQLITAKLNTANGASSVGILGLIAQADALINGLVVPPIGAGFLAPADASQLNAALGCWNTHGDGSDPEVPSTCPLVGPPHCEGIANPGLTSDKQEEPVTWGYVKSLLR